MQTTISSGSWSNLTDQLNLLPGVRYRISNNGSVPIGFAESIAEPAEIGLAASLMPGAMVEITATAGYSFWGIAESLTASLVLIEEVGGAIFRLPLFRFMSATGLPPVVPGVPTPNDVQILQDGSTTPVDYYVEALPGERYQINRFIIHIEASGNVGSGEYGNISELANGISIYWQPAGQPDQIDVTTGSRIKKNEDWGRGAYDARPVTFSTGQSPIFQSRVSIRNFNEQGLILNEGDRFGVKIRDNLGGLADHTILAQGEHFGIPSPLWRRPL